MTISNGAGGGMMMSRNFFLFSKRPIIFYCFCNEKENKGDSPTLIAGIKC